MVQPSFEDPHCLIKSCTSSEVLVLMEDINPSKTKTKGIIGIMYVKKRCPGDLQK